MALLRVPRYPVGCSSPAQVTKLPEDPTAADDRRQPLLARVAEGVTEVDRTGQGRLEGETGIVSLSARLWDRLDAV